MTTAAAIGHGSIFAKKVGSNFVPFAEITDLTPPALSRDAIDATHFNSPNKWREFIAGLKDGGEVSVEMNFIPGGTSHLAIVASFGVDVAEDYQIIFPNAVEWTFSAIVTGYEPGAPLDDKMTATATFKVSGQPDLSDAVGA